MPAETDSRHPDTGHEDHAGYVCVHGHFYQPPRENPWIEQIEQQDSASPYHDWNERIADECYAANAAARILDENGLISRITNNYARISFDFGPTLLGWLERARPEILKAVIDADRRSREMFSGHGSAMAQAYNHMIQPLASPRDRRTQVVWGIRDFEYRFGRAPAGMWLPETAADTDSLEALAEHGIRFTVLAPHQAAAVRAIGTDTWRPIDSQQALDTGIAYEVPLPSGRNIAVFFYDGPTSRAVAFDGLLENGHDFSERLLAPLRAARPEARLMHIATDGETYGHHHRFGDMALAFALQSVERSAVGRLTNYADFLHRFPPSMQASIVADTSWSCAHGIERWRSDCGCRSEPDRGWSQAWRGPLRDALDALRDELAPLFERCAAAHLRDPWSARDDYIEVILDRSAANVDAFLRRHALRELAPGERVDVLELLEMQRHAMLMYTSCGWFFDDLAGIETIQVLRYAGRALQLAARHGAEGTEERFVARLRKARSNDSLQGDGERVYRNHVEPLCADLRDIGAHYAISSLFDDGDGNGRVFCYQVEQLAHRSLGDRPARLAIGRCRLRSTITEESEELSYAALYRGQMELTAGVRPSPDDALSDESLAPLADAFDAGDLRRCESLLNERFAPHLYSLASLLGDRRRAVVAGIVEAAIDDLQRALDPDGYDLDRVEEILAASREQGIEIDESAVAFGMEQTATTIAARLTDCAAGHDSMAELRRIVDVAQRHGVEVKLWRAQNAFYRFLERCYREQERAAGAGDARAAAWLEQARALGAALRVRVD